jgi:hypothetical protein
MIDYTGSYISGEEFCAENRINALEFFELIVKNRSSAV